jgi:sugar phosphate isomerase/epimerase
MKENLMTQTRRTFIAGSALLGAGMIAAAPSARAFSVNENGKEGLFKLSCQEGVAPGRSLNEKLDFLEEHGFEGIEPGGGGLHKRVDEFKTALNGRKIKVSAICAGFGGAPVSEFADTRREAMESMKQILTAAGELGSTGLIFVPAFNSQSQAGLVAARFMLLDFLQEIAEHAEKANCRMLLEPLNRHETWYVRQLADAAKICQEVNHPYICMMGDFYHMGQEEICDYAAFLAARNWLHHVHLASRPHRQQPGFDDNDDFRPGFRALKEIGYQDFCSFECGIQGNAKGANDQETSDLNKRAEIPKSVEFLKRQWEEA